MATCTRSEGLSPRVRGNRALVCQVAVAPGSIPACAGEPFLAHPAHGLPGVYPACAGEPWRMSPCRCPQGSIPACAGEPIGRAPGVRPLGVYPRVCGGTNPIQTAAGKPQGLSPRVRGNRGILDNIDAPAGSIPACAGEPHRGSARSRAKRVYPRVCGGTFQEAFDTHIPTGLSPRVRGNPVLHLLEKVGLGSIPACAGEPTKRASVPEIRRVYPRVCGGTTSGGSTARGARGLSPRVRGNPKVEPRGGMRRGSIPACAGEP